MGRDIAFYTVCKCTRFHLHAVPADLNMAMEFGKTSEPVTEGAIANVAEAALNEAANIAPESIRPHIKVCDSSLEDGLAFDFARRK